MLVETGHQVYDDQMKDYEHENWMGKDMIQDIGFVKAETPKVRSIR
jgi:hypothetical protein